MRRILVLTKCQDVLNDKQSLGGQFIAMHNRVKYLKEVAKEYEIHPVIIEDCYSDLMCFLHKHLRRAAKCDSLELEGVSYKIVRRPYGVIDSICSLFSLPSLGLNKLNKTIIKRFGKFDLISLHNSQLGDMVMATQKRFGVPFTVTWHGTDIHTRPFMSENDMAKTVKLLQSANMNFFVSCNLKDCAASFCQGFKGQVLYNGASDDFAIFPAEKKLELRRKYSVENKKVVAFVGNLIEIKNTKAVVPIFKQIAAKYEGEVAFWVIGDGTDRVTMEKASVESGLTINFMGGQKKENMPALMNCVDVLIVPSLNEGLSLVSIEAISCGANVVSSKVGGIPEVVGQENAFVLDETFVERVSDRAVEMLTTKISQPLPKEMNWEYTAAKEYEIDKEII